MRKMSRLAKNNTVNLIYANDFTFHVGVRFETQKGVTYIRVRSPGKTMITRVSLYRTRTRMTDMWLQCQDIVMSEFVTQRICEGEGGGYVSEDFRSKWVKEMTDRIGKQNLPCQTRLSTTHLNQQDEKVSRHHNKNS